MLLSSSKFLVASLQSQSRGCKFSIENDCILAALSTTKRNVPYELENFCRVVAKYAVG